MNEMKEEKWNAKTQRIGEDFNKEIESIKQERMKSKIDKKKKSTRVLTNMITKHREWPTIKKDLIYLDFEEKHE